MHLIVCGHVPPWKYIATLSYLTSTTYNLHWNLIINGATGDGTATSSGSATWANSVVFDLVVTSPAINDVLVYNYTVDCRLQLS